MASSEVGGKHKKDEKSFNKFQDKRWPFILDECFEYPHPYVILKNAVFAPHLISKYWDLNNSKAEGGNFFSRKHFEYHTPVLSWKIQSFPHTSSPDSQIWNILRHRWVIFVKMNIWSTHSPMLSWKIQKFLPISPFQVVRFETFQDKRGSFFRQMFVYLQPYVILKNVDFAPYLLSK